MTNFTITTGATAEPVKALIYGTEGIGKTTLASKFPNPLFIDTEGSTKRMDVARLPTPETWTDILDEIRFVASHPDVCDTLVIDTIDWAENLCCAELLRENQWKSIESPGYGKGYNFLSEKFQRIFTELDKVAKAGIHVVITAHAMMRKFEQPDEMGAYDRWELKLQKKNAPLVKEWPDMVLFCNYKTLVINVDGQGANKGKNKAQGGERVIYTTHKPTWDAKNRFGLPDQIPMEYDAIAHVIKEVPKPEPKWKELQRKMETDGVDLFDLQNIVGIKGWADSTVEIKDYSNELIDFLLGNWEAVKAKITETKDSTEVPFDE